MKNLKIEELTSAEMTYVLGGGGDWYWDEETEAWHWVD